MALTCFFFFFQAEDGIRVLTVTGVQTCALPIFTRRLESTKSRARARAGPRSRGFSAHASPRLMASYRPVRSVRALAFSSLVRGAAAVRDDPAIGWRRLASATLRLGVGRPLAASAGGPGLAASRPARAFAPA